MKLDKDFLPLSVCPTCGYALDAATVIGKKPARPKPGDFSLCAKCGEILRFTDQLSLLIVEMNDLIGLDQKTCDLLSIAQNVIRRERFIP